jgi:hypothetical protein
MGMVRQTAHLAVGAVDLDHMDAGAPKETSQPRAIGPGAFDADLGHGAEAVDPLKQTLVAAGCGDVGLHTQYATDRVQGGGHMDVQMGVDTADHGRSASTMVLAIPSFLMVKGWHGRPGKE